MSKATNKLYISGFALYYKYGDTNISVQIWNFIPPLMNVANMHYHSLLGDKILCLVFNPVH